MLPIPCIFLHFFAPVFHCFLQTNENGKHDHESPKLLRLVSSQLDQQILPGPRLPTTSKACTTARQRLRYLVALLRAWPPFSKYFGTTSTTWARGGPGTWACMHIYIYIYITDSSEWYTPYMCQEISCNHCKNLQKWASSNVLPSNRCDAANLLFLTCSCMWAIEMDITYEYRFEWVKTCLSLMIWDFTWQSLNSWQSFNSIPSQTVRELQIVK